MKKIIKTLLVVMVVVLALAAFTACGNDPATTTTAPCQHQGGTATCTEQAVCELCGESYGAALGHKAAVLYAIDATCSKEGRTEGSYCKVCNEVLVAQESIEKLEHVWVANEDRDFTCTMDGLVGGNHCEMCGIQDGTIEVVPAQCRWGEPFVYAEPTCTETGIMAVECQVCGDLALHSEIDLIDHTYVYGVCSVCGALDANYVDYYLVGYINGANYGCEEDFTNLGEYKFVDGKLTVTFAQDSYVFVKSGNLKGQNVKWYLFESYVTGKEGTLYENKSEKMFIPANVEVVFTLTVNEDGTLALVADYHTHAHKSEVFNPTCTEAGKVVYTCECGDTYEEAGEAALGHDYDHITHNATCTAAGYVEHICALCDDTYTDGETEALGHADEDGNFKCDRCSTKMLPADGTTLTVEQALAIAQLGGSAYTTQKYYITGIVSGLYNTTYGNFYIKDTETGKEICIYGLYSADGKTRYDAMSYKPVNGDEVTVYTVLGMYNSTAQGKNAWLDDVVAHEHAYTSVVTEPTCTKAGFTTHTCSICNGYVVDTEVEALGHTTENGVCERCELTIGGDVVNKETFTTDWSKLSTNTSYTSNKTADGWQYTNAAVIQGGASNSNPTFKPLGTSATKGLVLNGKTSAKGKLVSPTLTGGLSKLVFNYTNVFSESKGVDITITIKQNGAVVATKQLDNNSVTQYTAYTFEWDLEAEGVAVTGDFTIEISNNSPSASTSNKDRVAIWNIEWTNNPAA